MGWLIDRLFLQRKSCVWRALILSEFFSGWWWWGGGDKGIGSETQTRKTSFARRRPFPLGFPHFWASSEQRHDCLCSGLSFQRLCTIKQFGKNSREYRNSVSLWSKGQVWWASGIIKVIHPPAPSNGQAGLQPIIKDWVPYVQDSSPVMHPCCLCRCYLALCMFPRGRGGLGTYRKCWYSGYCCFCEWYTVLYLTPRSLGSPASVHEIVAGSLGLTVSCYWFQQAKPHLT